MKFVNTYYKNVLINPALIRRVYIERDLQRTVFIENGEKRLPRAELKGYWLNVDLGGEETELHIAHYDSEENAQKGLAEFINNLNS